MTPLRLVYTTHPDDGRAEGLAEDLVDRKLAACVNIFPQMTAVYEYQNQFAKEREVALLIKTTVEKVAPLLTELKRLHPYETPALLVWNVEAEPVYAGWISDQVKSS